MSVFDTPTSLTGECSSSTHTKAESTSLTVGTGGRASYKIEHFQGTVPSKCQNRTKIEHFSRVMTFEMGLKLSEFELFSRPKIEPKNFFSERKKS